MLNYIIRRLFLMIPTLVGMTFVVFMVMALSPGGIGGSMLDEAGQLDSEQARSMRKYYEERYGIDDPVFVQYGRWLARVCPVGFYEVERFEDKLSDVEQRMAAAREANESTSRISSLEAERDRVLKEQARQAGKGWGFQTSKEYDEEDDELVAHHFGIKWPDLGNSMAKKRPVLDLYSEALPITVLLNIITVPIVFLLAIVMGVYAAQYRGRAFDVVLGVLLIGLWSLPTIMVGVMFIGFLANERYVRWFPTGGISATSAGQMPFLPRDNVSFWFWTWTLAAAGYIIACSAGVWWRWRRQREQPISLKTYVALALGVVTVSLALGGVYGYLSGTLLAGMWIVVGAAWIEAIFTRELVLRIGGCLLGLVGFAAACWLMYSVDYASAVPAFEGLDRGWLLDRAWHLVGPVICLSYGSFAVLMKLMRASTLENITADFVRTARAKGVEERLVLWKHAFRNSLLPLITVAIGIIPGLLVGSVVVERIFSIPGMGKLMVEAAMEKDRELIMAGTLIGGVLVLICILIADLLYALVDPRVSYE